MTTQISGKDLAPILGVTASALSQAANKRNHCGDYPVYAWAVLSNSGRVTGYAVPNDVLSKLGHLPAAPVAAPVTPVPRANPIPVIAPAPAPAAIVAAPAPAPVVVAEAPAPAPAALDLSAELRALKAAIEDSQVEAKSEPVSPRPNPAPEVTPVNAITSALVGKLFGQWLYQTLFPNQFR